MPAEPAQVFAALGDDTRLALMARLVAEGPSSIVRLTTGAAMSRQALTKHLRVLERAGLVRASRIGRTAVWQAVPATVDRVRRSLDILSRQWDGRIARLKEHVEGDRT